MFTALFFYFSAPMYSKKKEFIDKWRGIGKYKIIPGS